MSDSHCIYINLARSTARRAYMDALFERMSLPVRRFDAVDGASLSDDKIQNGPELAPDPKPLSAGEIGCFLSHRNIWREIAAGSTQHVAVFEDDIMFSDDAATLLRDLHWIPAKVGFLKLDTGSYPAIVSGLRPVPGTERQIGRLRSRLFGTAGYIISKDYARLLLARTTKLRAPIDMQLFYPEYRTFRRMTCWQLTPAICIQQAMSPDVSFLPSEAEVSRIEPERQAIERDYRPPKLPFGFAKLKREINRPFRNWTMPWVKQRNQRRDVLFRK